MCLCSWKLSILFAFMRFLVRRFPAAGHILWWRKPLTSCTDDPFVQWERSHPHSALVHGFSRFECHGAAQLQNWLRCLPHRSQVLAVPNPWHPWLFTEAAGPFPSELSLHSATSASGQGLHWVGKLFHMIHTYVVAAQKRVSGCPASWKRHTKDWFTCVA